MDAIMNAAEPLPPARRSGFLHAVAQALRGHPELGDGLVACVCAEQQRKFFDAPDLGGSGRAAKYR